MQERGFRWSWVNSTENSTEDSIGNSNEKSKLKKSYDNYVADTYNSYSHKIETINTSYNNLIYKSNIKRIIKRIVQGLSWVQSIGKYTLF